MKLNDFTQKRKRVIKKPTQFVLQNDAAELKYQKQIDDLYNELDNYKKIEVELTNTKAYLQIKREATKKLKEVNDSLIAELKASKFTIEQQEESLLQLPNLKEEIKNFDTELSISESEIETINTLSKKVERSTLMVFWQFILKGLEELSIVANQILSLEMLVIRLIYLKDLPSYEELLNSLDKNMIDSNSEKINSNKNIEVKSISKDQIKNKTQVKPELISPNPETIIQKEKKEIISSFEDLIKLSSKKREIELKYDLEKNVNLIKFSQGNIDISLNEKLGKNFVRNLSERLLAWTGKRWVITLSKQQGSESFSEMQLKKSSEILENAKKSEVYKKFKNVFSDGDLIKVTKEE